MKDSTAQVLRELRRNPEGVCLMELEERLFQRRFSARILELRQAGYEIETSACRRHLHHPTSHLALYRLVAEPPEGMAS